MKLTATRKVHPETWLLPIVHSTKSELGETMTAEVVEHWEMFTKLNLNGSMFGGEQLIVSGLSKKGSVLDGILGTIFGGPETDDLTAEIMIFGGTPKALEYFETKDIGPDPADSDCDEDSPP